MRCRSLVLAVLALAATGTRAHDTWFESRSAADGAWSLALGTGNLFPLLETAVGAEHLVQRGCDGDRPLEPGDLEPHALRLHATADAQDCWVQLAPFEVELAPALVETYLREVNPPPALRSAWAALQARGLPWRERYVKHARIVRGDALAAAPSGLGLDVLLESRTPLSFRVLRDGVPLPGFAVEFRHERSRFGVWRRTDADGRITFAAPLAGAWVLRGIDLRLSASDPDRFDSRFVTLAFEQRAQNGISSSPNARSTNQPPAMATISTEPPANTARR